MTATLTAVIKQSFWRMGLHPLTALGPKEVTSIVISSVWTVVQVSGPVAFATVAAFTPGSSTAVGTDLIDPDAIEIDVGFAQVNDVSKAEERRSDPALAQFREEPSDADRRASEVHGVGPSRSLEGSDEATRRIVMLHGDDAGIRAAIPQLQPAPDLVVAVDPSSVDPTAAPTRIGDVPMVFAGTRGRVLLDVWLHRDATLSEADWKSVCDWSMEEADRLSAAR